MSFIHRDFLTPARLVNNLNFALFRAFEKAFPKINIGGVEVYSNRLYLYSNDTVTQDTITKRFLNKLGFEYEKLHQQDYTGLESVFFTFDPKKYNYVDPENTDILDYVTPFFQLDDIFSIKITYAGNSLRYFLDHDFIKSDINNLVAKLDTDPVKFYALSSSNANETQTYNGFDNATQKGSPRVPPVSIKTESGDFQSFALLDDGTYFQRTIRNVEIKTVTTAFDGKLVDEISFIFDFKVIQVPNSVNSLMIQRLKEISTQINIDMNANQSNGFDIKGPLSGSTIQNGLIQMQTEDTTLFYNGYLRVDVVKNMKKSKFCFTLSKILKIDYTEKPVKWYKKVLAVVVIIAAVVVAYYTMNPAAIGSATGWVLAGKVAVGLAWVSTTLTVGMMAVGAIGGQSNLGSYGRFIAGAAQITGIAASVLGAFVSIRSIMTAASTTGTVTMGQTASALSSINNLNSTYNNLMQDGAKTQTTEDNTEMMSAYDIENYREFAMENDAITLTDMLIQSNVGGNMTQTLILNQQNS